MLERRTIIAIIEVLLERKRIVFIIVFLIFWIAAITYSFYLGDRLRYPDERWYYEEYAQNIARTYMFTRDGIHPTAFHPPGYPLILSFIVMMGGGIVAARLINFLALFASMFCLHTILKHRSYRIAPLFSIFLILGYPVLFYTAGTLYPQTLGAFFFLVSLMFYLKEPMSFRDAILSGIFQGIAILTIPTFAFVPIFLLVFSFIFRKEVVRKTIVLFVIVTLVVSPWMIRNYFIFGRFMLSSNFGVNFLLGNSPSTTPNSGTLAVEGIRHILEQAQGLDEIQRDQFFTQQALRYIKENPLHYLKLYFLKVLNYFNFRNELATSSESSPLRDFLMLISYGPLLLIAVIYTLAMLIIGVARFRQSPWSLIHYLRQNPKLSMEIFLIALYLMSAIVIAVIFTRIRFRLPYDYLLIGYVAIALEKFMIKFVYPNIKDNHLIIVNRLQ